MKVKLEIESEKDLTQLNIIFGYDGNITQVVPIINNGNTAKQVKETEKKKEKDEVKIEKPKQSIKVSKGVEDINSIDEKLNKLKEGN